MPRGARRRGRRCGRWGDARCWRAAPEGAVGPFRRAGGGDTLERLPAVDRSADTAQQ